MNTHQNHKMHYAIKDGTFITIADALPGLKCGCTCPACGKPLVAKKGKNRIHHFAHQAGETCAHGYETSLHLVAKEILAKAKQIVLPDLYTNIYRHNFTALEAWETIRVIEKQNVIIDHVDLETFSDEFIPDVTIYFGEQKVHLEIRVSHKIDERKLEKIKKSNVSTIEIDLSKWPDYISYEELKELLIGNNQWKKWIHNSFSQAYVDGLLKYISSHTERQKVITDSSSPLREKLCPIKLMATIERDVHIWRCQKCNYCWGYDAETNTVQCTGRERIGTIKEFKALYDAEYNIP